MRASSKRGREGKGAHCRTPCLEVSMPRSRLVFAFGSLACVAVAAAACTTSPSAPETAEATGNTQAALTPAVAYHGIRRPPPKDRRVRADLAAAPTASYAPTGGCASPLQYYGGPIIGNPVVVQVSWNDPTSVVSASVETYLQTWWPAIISPQAGYLAWLTEYDALSLNGVDGLAGSTDPGGRAATRDSTRSRRRSQTRGRPSTTARSARRSSRKSRRASCRCRRSTRTVTATRST